MPFQHLYVHVPFCTRRCSYCDFSIAIRKQVPAEDFVATIQAELKQGGPLESLETVYLGGGTPSLLPPESIRTILFDVLHSTSSLDAVEVTLEANPENVTANAARAWRAAGVNRVSLGAQSFDDRVLEWMHRTHDAAQIARAVKHLRDAGVDNISLDLIFALPESLERDWDRDLDLGVALAPSHLSLYGLTVEPRTPLDRWISRGAIQAPSDDRYADEYLRAHERLSAAGYEFYEVSNAARDGRRSRHNSAYWSGRPYLGVGPAAHSFDGRTRRWNYAAWEAYRSVIAAGESPIDSREELTGEQRQLERLYLGLRTVEGIASSDLARPLPPSSALFAQGWLLTDGARLRCTPSGWLRLDSLVAALTGNLTTS
ncbi:MAG TPA: radical SAM family heme chaperone HemW [Gemmatimonadales bacterium]|nr:radical SAM family heme chaperone HemW [Gemmatimonadales bacterium]